MRFIARVLWGLLIVALCAAILGYGGWTYRKAAEEAAKEPPRRPAPERIYTVSDLVLERKAMEPVTRAYGKVEARRTLELRAAIPGRIVDITPDFKKGARVAAGALLVRVDPTSTESREADLFAGLNDARSRLADAQQAGRLAEAELDAALRQQNLRQQAYGRQKQLFDRGVASRAAVENAELALGADRQAVISRRQALTAARSRAEQSQLAVERAEIALADARRDVADADIVAPFDGVLDGTAATLGRLVSSNESLGRLIDLRSLEVAFRLTDAQFSRVLDAREQVQPLRATVILRLGERKIETQAVLDRAAATATAEGGRTLYAALRTTSDTPLRPGDFVEVRLTEPRLDNVAEIPARAITEDGIILVIGAEDRIEEQQATILRRQVDSVVIADAPFGARIVAELRPQLGPGIRVQTAEQAAEAAEKARVASAARRGGGRPGGNGRPGGGGRPGADGKPSGTDAGKAPQRPDGRGAGQGRPQPEAPAPSGNRQGGS